MTPDLAGYLTTVELRTTGDVRAGAAGGTDVAGVAAAFAIPAALATGASTSREEPWRSRVFSVIAFASWAAGPAGAVLSGLITVHFGWRWGLWEPVPATAPASSPVWPWWRRVRSSR